MEQLVVEVSRVLGYILILPAVIAVVSLPLNVLDFWIHRKQWPNKKKWRFFVLIYLDCALVVCTSLFLWGHYLGLAMIIGAIGAPLLYSIPCGIDLFNWGGWKVLRNAVVVTGGLLFATLAVVAFAAGLGY
jgi:hypothetical protein